MAQSIFINILYFTKMNFNKIKFCSPKIYNNLKASYEVGVPFN